jgi:lysophospholipase L1-like esterase
VVVLSIPDYSVTPFAREKDPERVAHEVDIFNATNRAVAAQYKVHYADITPGSREASGDPELVAADGLHPSAHEYKKWAQIVSAILAEGTK